MNNIINIFDIDKEFLLPTYNRIPLNISHGKGVFLFTEDGEKYLDFFCGLAVNALGYGNERIIQAIDNQLKNYIHLSNYYVNLPQIKLAEQLVKHSGLNKVFFTNSGTEATESSLKLVRKVQGPDKRIITFSNAFHGRTYGSLSLGGKEKYKKHFSPLLPNIIQLEFNNIEQLKQNVDVTTGAIYVEFIQGEGGVQVASKDFVEELAILKEKYDFLLIADEIQTGIGRTGKAFSYNHFNIEPDVILVAKAIGGGLPLGAMIVNKKYSEALQLGDHGSTFGGNPVACSAGLVVIDEVLNKELVKNVNDNGVYFLNQLNELHTQYPDQITDVRGIGFMIGVEFSEACAAMVEEFRKNKILVNCTSEIVLRILPPLIATREHIDHFLEVFKSILDKK